MGVCGTKQLRPIRPGDILPENGATVSYLCTDSMTGLTYFI